MSEQAPVNYSAARAVLEKIAQDLGYLRHNVSHPDLMAQLPESVRGFTPGAVAVANNYIIDGVIHSNNALPLTRNMQDLDQLLAAAVKNKNLGKEVPRELQERIVSAINWNAEEIAEPFLRQQAKQEDLCVATEQMLGKSREEGIAIIDQVLRKYPEVRQEAEENKAPPPLSCPNLIGRRIARR